MGKRLSECFEPTFSRVVAFREARIRPRHSGFLMLFLEDETRKDARHIDPAHPRP